MKTNEAGGVELVVAESSEKQPDIIRAVSSELVGTALSEYQRIQQALDKALPDCIMQIGDKQFRKKNYWRAVATAFNLQIEEVEGSEQVERKPDGAPLSVSVTYRASASNGRSATGDGACEAAEKVVYLWRDNERTDEPDERKTKANQTLHNIRAHAHTRAYNRAVSNLVGFGEVSAEEIYEPTPLPKRPAPPPPAPVPSDPTPPPPPAAEGGGVEILPAWLDEPLGFGKYKAKSWREFLDTDDEDLPDYLHWYMGQEHKGRNQQALARRCAMILNLRAARRNT